MLTRQAEKSLPLDHADARPVAAGPAEETSERVQIVRLDPNHPGFRDAEYRARRNRIAGLAARYRRGQPLPEAPYTAEEYALWRTVRAALAPRHRAHACAEYLACAAGLDISRERIPQLGEMSEKVCELSGFRLEPVAGMVEPRVFLESLADGVFLCTQYIRHHSTPFYTPEPDVVHELLGHGVTLASPRLAELNRLFGRAVRRAPSSAALERLSRLYWFTVEFGVLREEGELKAYGTGLLSSAGELEAMHAAELRPLDLHRAARQDFDPTSYQPVLFCADSFESMFLRLKEYLLAA